MRRDLVSVLYGLIITIVLTGIASVGGSREWACTFAWQACLTQMVIHTPDNPIHEASPIDLFGFVIGVLLGIPIYAVATYVVLRFSDRISGKKSELRS